MKKALFLLLTLIAPVWAVGQGFSGSGSGTSSDPYLIFNPIQLDQIRNFLDQSDVYFKLMADIDLDEYIADNNPTYGWQPVGTDGERFKGVLDGNNKTISNIWISRSTTDYVGFFGYTDQATIKDLTLVYKSGKDCVGKNETGLVIGSDNGSTINNVSASISSTVGLSSAFDVGGFIGYCTGSNISNCSVTAQYVVASRTCGGFVGLSSGSTFTNNTVTASVRSTSSSSYDLGGFVGSNTNGTFTNCVSTQASNAGTYGHVYGGYQLGGFVGSTSAGTFSSCSANGKVTSLSTTDGNVGGFIGKTLNATTTTGCSAFGEVNAKAGIVGGFIGYAGNPEITSCGAHGNITGKGDAVGGLVGYCMQSTTVPFIKNSYSVGDINTTGNYAGGLVGQIEETLSNINMTTEYSNNGRLSPGYDNGSKTRVAIHHYSVFNNGTKYTSGSSSYDHEIKWVSNSDFTDYGCVFKESNTLYSVGNTTAFPGYKIIDYTSYYESGSSSYLYITIGNTVYSSSTTPPSGYYKYVYFCASTSKASNTSISINDNYHSGKIEGKNCVGGLIGKSASTDLSILRNLNIGDVYGTDSIGGLCGHLNDKYSIGASVLKSNVALSNNIGSSGSKVGRVYGILTGNTGNITVGASGTSERNYALTACKVSVNGVEQTIADNLQNGDSRGASTLKYAATYQGIGWDFNNDWSIQETESYPYNPAQTAPPVIQSTPVSGGTTLSGKATTGSTVYVVIGSTTYQTTAANNAWSVTVPAMQSGASLYAYAKATDKDYSYRTPATVGFAGSGTEEDPYQIYTATDLANINSASYYKLMNDIDLTSYINANSPTDGWIPLGRSAATPVSFDGDGHTISGLWTNTTADYTGLFATLTDATVKNLTIKVNTAKQVKGGLFTGILAGKTNDCSFADIAVEGTVFSTGLYVGGVVGVMDGTTSKEAQRLTASVNVTGAQYVGGITGYAPRTNLLHCSATGTINGASAVGGICGQSDATIKYDKFDGDVTATTKWAGGITGYATYVEYCTSSGTVTCSGTDTESIAGGIAGVGYSTGAYIKNCYSTADITAYQYAAGIMGYSKMAVSNCYSSGNITASNVAAGVVGYNDGSSATIHNCVALNPTLSVSLSTGYGMRVLGGYKNEAPTPTTDNFALKSMALSVNGISQQIYDDLLNGTSYVADNFKVASFYTNLGWDFSTDWGIDEGTGYPYLQWERTVTHNVIYKVDGQVYQTQSYEEGAAITPLEAPTRDGYTFSGWSEIPATMGTEDIIVTGTFTQNPQYTLGDINNDGELNVGDLSRLVNMILNDYSTPGATFSAADINADGELNVGDYSRLVQMILNAPVAGSKAFLGGVRSNSYRPAAVFMHSDDIALSAGQTKLVAVGMTNYDNTFNAIQFDLQLPAGLEIDVEATETAARTYGFDIATNGSRVILSNTRNATITGGEGDIVYLAVKAADNIKLGSYELAFGNVLLSTTDNEVVKAGGFYSTVMAEDPTGISSATSNPNSQPSYIYDLQGRKVTGKPSKGIYVINGKKVNVK